MSLLDAHSPGAIPGARFMDPVVLARIGNLSLVARAVVDGFINGLHKAPYFGASVDFAEHRGYVPGDDIRRMDWRLWARTDRYYIKEYEAETNMNFSVLMDASKSMDYGTRGITKFDYAKILAACLTNLVHHQRDRVGFVAFDSEVIEHVPPSAKHMETVLHVLDRLKPGRTGSLKEPLHKLAEHFGRRGVIDPQRERFPNSAACLFERTAIDVASANGRNVGDPSAAYIALVDASQVTIVDDGVTELSLANGAAIEMRNDPTNSSTTPTATTVVSLFQVESSALKMVRHANWRLNRSGMAQVIREVDY